MQALSLLIGEPTEAQWYGTTMLTVGGVFFLVMLGRLFGNVLNCEIYQQTLVSLCMLPKSRSQVISQLYLGLVPGLLAPLFCFGLGFVWLGFLDAGFIRFFTYAVVEPWSWAILGWLIMTVASGNLAVCLFETQCDAAASGG